MQFSDILWGEMIGTSIGDNAKHILSGIRIRGITLTYLTIKQLLFSRKTIVLLLLCLIPILLALYWVTTDSEDGYAFFFILIYLSFLFFIVVIISLLYGTSCFNDEITENTITYLLSRPVHRFELAIYKYVGLVISACVVVLPPLVITFFIIALKTGDIWANIGFLTIFSGVIILAVIGYGAIFLFFGIIFKRPMLISFIFMFVWETTFASIPLLINQITLRHYLESVLFHSFSLDEAQDVAFAADPFWSVIIIIILSLVFLILSGIVTKIKDFA
jgi:ABC-2 type transport system permease protein